MNSSSIDSEDNMQTSKLELQSIIYNPELNMDCVYPRVILGCIFLGWVGWVRSVWQKRWFFHNMSLKKIFVKLHRRTLA